MVAEAPVDDSEIVVQFRDRMGARRFRPTARSRNGVKGLVDMVEAVGRGGAKRPSEARGGTETLASVMALVHRLAVDQQGRETAGSRAIDRLHGHDEREVFLREMISAFRPPEVDAEIWLRWLAGGEEPFAPTRPAKPRMTQTNVRREIGRASNRVQSARSKVEEARRKLAEAEAEEAGCIEFESAVVSWALMERMAGLVAPLFAMGPAWTLMRVVGPHVDVDEMAEELTLEEEPKARKTLEDAVRAERVDLSKRFHRVLDLWAGDAGFESDMRRAMQGVMEQYEPREDEARAKGRKLRSPAEMAGSVRPDPAAPREQVLGVEEEAE